MSVCLFFRTISFAKTDAARITKLGVEMFHDMCWKLIYFCGLKVKCTSFFFSSFLLSGRCCHLRWSLRWAQCPHPHILKWVNNAVRLLQASKVFANARYLVTRKWGMGNLEYLGVWQIKRCTLLGSAVPFLYLLSQRTSCISVRICSRTLLYTDSSFRAQIVSATRAELTFRVNSPRAAWLPKHIATDALFLQCKLQSFAHCSIV